MASLFLAANNMQIYYMSSTYQYFRMIRYQIYLVISSALLDFISVLFSAPVIVLAVLTLLCLIIYWFLITRYVRNDLDLRIRETTG